MSIENNLKRIADVLEALAGKLDHIGQATVTPKQPIEAPEQHIQAPPPPVEQPPKTAAAPPPVEQVTQTPLPSITAEDLNKALVAEFQRLGSRESIDTVMRAAPFNAQSITDLTAEQYAPLIAAVQAVKAG